MYAAAARSGLRIAKSLAMFHGVLAKTGISECGCCPNSREKIQEYLPFGASRFLRTRTRSRSHILCGIIELPNGDSRWIGAFPFDCAPQCIGEGDRLCSYRTHGLQFEPETRFTDCADDWRLNQWGRRKLLRGCPEKRAE